MKTLAGLLLLLSGEAAAQDVRSISAGFIALRADPSAGTFVLSGAHTTEIPGLWMNGVFQRGFRVLEGPLAIGNDSVEVRAEAIAPDAIAVTWTPRRSGVHDFRLRIRSDDETEYYGTGERFQALNQRGFILPMRVDDRYGNKGVGSHKPVPFFMSSRGFGVWVDSDATGVFDLSGSERFNTDIVVADTRLRVVFIGGPSMARILETFTALTGRSPVPPAWSFGLWKSRDVHRNRDEVLEDVEKLRSLRIPASVLVIDSPWETGYNDFAVNREQFAGAEAMFARIQELGFHLALWLTPFVNNRNVVDMKGIAPASRNFAEAAAGGHLVRNADGSVALSDWWKGTGGLVDFTSARAKEWWFEQLRKTKWTGVRAFKCDDGEGNFVPDAVFSDGTAAALMKNRYSTLYNHAMQEYIDRDLGGDGVLIIRSGYTGAQKFPFAWAGDNRADLSFSDGLPSVILAAQNAALSGLSLWGSDIAGYAGTPDRETFVRWTQFATFCPFMQVHMTSNLGPWDFGEEAQEIFRRFAVLRMQLFPYLYEAAHETARSGMPVIRPMVLAFPEDRLAHQQIYQFLFGPDLLVAPMYRPGRSRAVYLPKGTWFDYWTGAEHDGPAMLDVSAPLDRIPLFVRSGAVITMLPEDVQTLVPRHSKMHADVVAMDDRRVVRVWPGEATRRVTWDGMTIEADRTSVRITANQPRRVEIRFAVGGEADAVSLKLQPGRQETISRPPVTPSPRPQ